MLRSALRRFTSVQPTVLSSHPVRYARLGLTPFLPATMAKSMTSYAATASAQSNGSSLRNGKLSNGEKRNVWAKEGSSVPSAFDFRSMIKLLHPTPIVRLVQGTQRESS